MIMCVGGDLFLVPGYENPMPLHCYDCIKRIIPNVKNEKSAPDCDNGSTVMSVGFNIAGRSHLPLYKSCINMNTKQVHWVDHSFRGTANYEVIQGTEYSWVREGFNSPHGANLENAYKKQSQRLRFPTLINDSTFFAKGHLFPNADGVFGSHRSATYTYFNAVPQWQTINNGNWKAIEKKVRDYSNTRGNVDIRTGAYGSWPIQFELSVNGPPIPKWIYKKVPVNGKTYYLFNVYNYPAGAATNDHWCGRRENLCAQQGFWHIPQFNNAEKGLVFCCEIDIFDEL
jgi:hypothetical protein